MELGQSLVEHEDIARRCKLLELKIKDYQDSFNAIEKVLAKIYLIKIYQV